MQSIYLRILSSVLIALSLVRCGGAQIPQEALTAAQAGIKGAEVAGASEDPKATLHLKLAREQIEQANRYIADGDNELAARVLDRAQADADLALALARKNRAQMEAEEADHQVEELRKKAR